MSGETADLVAARVTGIGIGLVVFMVTWLVGNRLTGLIWDAPVGPVVAMVTAIAAGTLVAVLAGRRLTASTRS
jgi:hypothetical protein